MLHFSQRLGNINIDLPPRHPCSQIPGILSIDSLKVCGATLEPLQAQPCAWCRRQITDLNPRGQKELTVEGMSQGMWLDQEEQG